MHDGCSGKFDDGMQVLAKLRMMGFSKQEMPFPMTFTCKECGEEITRLLLNMNVLIVV